MLSRKKVLRLFRGPCQMGRSSKFSSSTQMVMVWRLQVGKTLNLAVHVYYILTNIRTIIMYWSIISFKNPKHQLHFLSICIFTCYVCFLKQYITVSHGNIPGFESNNYEEISKIINSENRILELHIERKKTDGIAAISVIGCRPKNTLNGEFEENVGKLHKRKGKQYKQIP